MAVRDQARGEPLLRVQYRLTERDLVLLGWLADHGVLTTEQVAHALYPSLDFAQRRLLKLTHAGLIDRFRPQRADGGSHPYHYVASQLGLEVIAAQRDEEDLPRRDRARKRRWWLTNRANLPHLLAVNQFFIDLAGHARTHPGTALERWWSSARCQQQGAFARLDGDYDHQVWGATVAADGHGVWTQRITHLSSGARALTTVADVVTLLGAWLQPARDRLATVRWTLWKQAHRLRAQVSHYQQRGEPVPAHLRI